MDRISGLMPQVGWSPLLTVAAPKTAPASTVEAAANAANTNGGLGANVDTQTSQDRAQQVRALEARAARGASALKEEGQDRGTEDASQPSRSTGRRDGGARPDPDALTGPIPTFEVTPLEAQAAALWAAPDLVESSDTSVPEPVQPADTIQTTDTSAEERAEVKPPDTAKESRAEPAPQAEEKNDAPSDHRSGASQEGWSQVAPQVAPNLDVTR
ncbi:hypothetical protein [Thioclava electrotropha]|uniref:Flagellar hook-length control protein-like C-terminal domain-containing protein n=1 Tax=Thioclava electrotropha TaxID=1549850 RepID=A0ABX6YS83_9RHOB|nr:hypothetical protein [Thioclava electrotropha]QPZ90595.1 hypothetical protein AKL02_006565 [Thioclava electrotropha]